MKTVSFSLDEETSQGIKSLAKKSKMSSSDVVRVMYAWMYLDTTLEEMQKIATSLLQRLGLKTEDDVAEYIKSKT